MFVNTHIYLQNGQCVKIIWMNIRTITQYDHWHSYNRRYLSIMTCKVHTVIPWSVIKKTALKTKVTVNNVKKLLNIYRTHLNLFTFTETLFPHNLKAVAAAMRSAPDISLPSTATRKSPFWRRPSISAGVPGSWTKKYSNYLLN